MVPLADTRIWNPDCKGPCDCPGEEIKPVSPEHPCFCGSWSLPYSHALGDHYRRRIVTGLCPGHKLIQHRDMKGPWCNACGRDAKGDLIGKPRG